MTKKATSKSTRREKSLYKTIAIIKLDQKRKESKHVILNLELLYARSMPRSPCT